MYSSNIKTCGVLARLLVLSFLLFLSGKSLASNLSASGTPKLVRSNPRTEVFFVDLSQSYWIDQDSRHNPLQKAFIEASKKNKKIQFIYDEDTRKIIGVDGVGDIDKNESLQNSIDSDNKKSEK